MAKPRSFLFLAVLVAVTAVGPLAMQIFLPALPAIQDGFGVSPGAAQLVISLSLFTMALATLAYGPLSDRFGRRPLVLAGLAVFLVGSVACTLAPNLESLIAARVVQAAGGVAGMVLARAIVRDLYEREEAAQVIAYLTIAMVVVPMLAPTVGGVLTDLSGWRSVFAFTAAAGVVVAVLAVGQLPETHRREQAVPGAGAMLASFGRLLRNPAFCSYAFTGAFSIAVFFTFISGTPYVMARVLERPATEYGLYFMLISLAFMSGNFTAARLSQHFGVDRMMRFGMLLAVLGTGLAVVLAVAGVWAPMALFGPGMAMAFGSGAAMPNTQAGAVSVDPSAAGAASGLSGFLQLAVGAVPAQLVGMLQDGTPYPLVTLMFVCALLAFAASLLPLWLPRRPAATATG